MKTILTLLIVGAISLNSEASTNAMLRGIRIVETQDQLHPPRGKLGERGPYQFRRATWRMHTKSSFDLAENRDVANSVAKRHYAWIEAQLKASGLEPSPHNVAMAWNAGVNAVIRGRVPAVARDYATRVVNLAGTFIEQTQEEPAVAEVEPAKTKTWAPSLLVLDNPTTTDPTAIVSLPGPLTLALSTPTEALAQSAEAPAPAVEEPIVESPVTVAASEVVELEDDQHAVRFHTDPIMLAFSRGEGSVTTTGESTVTPTTTTAQTEFPLDAVLVANAAPTLNSTAEFELRMN